MYFYLLIDLDFKLNNINFTHTLKLRLIPQEFRRKMIVLLDTSDKDPLHSQKKNFVNKRRLAFL